jgi:hypothetical protein
MRCQKLMWCQNPSDAAAPGRNIAMPHFFRGHITAQMFARTFDPDNRLVADTLEADWNEHLRRLDGLQQEHDQRRAADKVLLNDEARARILALARDFPRVWNNPRTAPLERKRMLALLIEDATLLKDGDIAIHVRFRGGQTVSLSIPRYMPMAEVRKTRSTVIQKLDELLQHCSDHQAAQQLNALGLRNWKGDSFTKKRVSYMRRLYGLKSCADRLRDQGFLTGEEMAQQLGVSPSQIHGLGRTGVLPRQRVGGVERYLYAPLNGAVLANGRGGRYGSKRPTLIRAQPSGQEAV